MHDKNFVTLLAESRQLAREGAHRGIVSSNAPANLITILIGVRFCSSIPNMLLKFSPACPAAPFPRLSRQETMTSGIRLSGRIRIAEIGCVQRAAVQAACRGPIRIWAARRRTCDRAPQRLPRLAAPRDSRRSWTESARERQQMRRKHDLIFRETGMLRISGVCPVREQPIGLKSRRLRRMQIAARILAGATRGRTCNRKLMLECVRSTGFREGRAQGFTPVA